MPAETPHRAPMPSSDILRSIWDLVRQRGLNAGDQLPPIRELAEWLDVKQTAVRDALLQAQAMGQVRILPRAGAFLQAGMPGRREDAWPIMIQSALNQEEPNWSHVLEARRLIELQLVTQAAERRRIEDLLPVRRALEEMLKLPADASRLEYVEPDIRFHVEISRLAGNSVLIVIQQTLLQMLRSLLNQQSLTPDIRAITDRAQGQRA